MLVNTQEFRREAIYFDKYGKYDCGEKGSRSYNLWWDEQKRRCIYGYRVGGMWIPGLYYSYLNFNKIEVKVKVGKKSLITRSDFPAFWDADYRFYMCVVIAKNGMIDSYGIPCTTYEQALEEYKKLPIDLGLQLDEDNLEGGKHLFWMKPRGVGASWKASGIASRNFHHIEGSKTFMLADNDEFLIKDGLFNKFMFIRNFLNEHTEFKVSAFKSDTKEMTYVSGYDAGGRANGGLNSQVMGIPMAADPDKVRGKRGEYFLWEEFGNFRKVAKAWEILKMSQEEGGMNFGTSVAFGTGGTESEAADHMEDFAFNPRAHGLLAFKNVYDADMEGSDCTLFTPAYYNIQMIDQYGNSDLEKAKSWINTEYDKAIESKDPMKIIRRRAELPTTLRDSLMSVGTNKFSVDGLDLWKNKLKVDASLNIGVPKVLRKDGDGKVIAEFNPLVKPINKYPHRQDDDVRGCVVEYATPYVDDSGNIPDNLYFICCDPYAVDDAEDVTSLGAAYVIMNFNNIVPNDVGDRIVASWIGRRKTTSEYSDILFMLAERWNAKICFESDRGTIPDDAKNRNKTHLLVKELSLSFDEQIATKNVSNFRYGVKISSGRFNVKMLTGDQYIVNWLQKARTTNVGRNLYNYHFIHDIGLLEEFSKYKQGEGNYDRISALRVGMFYQRELIYKNQVPEKVDKNKISQLKMLRLHRNSNIKGHGKSAYI